MSIVYYNSLFHYVSIIICDFQSSLKLLDGSSFTLLFYNFLGLWLKIFSENKMLCSAYIFIHLLLMLLKCYSLVYIILSDYFVICNMSEYLYSFLERHYTTMSNSIELFHMHIQNIHHIHSEMIKEKLKVNFFLIDNLRASCHNF